MLNLHQMWTFILGDVTLKRRSLCFDKVFVDKVDVDKVAVDKVVVDKVSTIYDFLYKK